MSLRGPARRRPPILKPACTSDRWAGRKRCAPSLYEPSHWKPLPDTAGSMHWHTRTALQLRAQDLHPMVGWYKISYMRTARGLREITCSYECELKAINECLRVVIRRQREGAALSGVVIFNDFRALVQALGGSDSESVRGAELLTDYLQKTE
ncbi:hypothetical protein PoB_006585400 [Plakobranchus ocellatus]|uniref:Uncharacterized protein n=1 Tax=Plakobranchus ocellatus TaxID=259542 RepID=A0AAV4D5A4_9GAST|nr:hypothetical protein PoB_006585400 [Plakobranchus ocellatus]